MTEDYILLTTADQPQAPLLTMAALNTYYILPTTYYLLRHCLLFTTYYLLPTTTTYYLPTLTNYLPLLTYLLTVTDQPKAPRPRAAASSLQGACSSQSWDALIHSSTHPTLQACTHPLLQACTLMHSCMMHSCTHTPSMSSRIHALSMSSRTHPRIHARMQPCSHARPTCSLAPIT
jgi:hypothetical protein